MHPQTYRAARKERGSQVEVAALLGVDRATLRRRENGDIPVTREAALALLSLPVIDGQKR